MTLTKNDIVAKVNDLGFTKKKSAEVVESLLEIMKDALAEGEDVLVSGFGKFCIKQKRPRRGRNPATGEALLLDQRKVVTFKCSGKLREAINGDGDQAPVTPHPV
ncbi:integration host factor subunit alpha [Desulfatitalea alkaliphila]|uniref:Integration host factor subunit alpha n=1 Tax=Desulfatitalea alkaliphila TaxID=2929485 RepID=A0AA41R303_9BACT|nr:integration host factor subunit alpha [Desulfatitalea alkaliphila]MCJ8499970.1 integration host factor subunit alpha [Desulfatitalea alkaliphila]